MGAPGAGDGLSGDSLPPSVSRPGVPRRWTEEGAQWGAAGDNLSGSRVCGVAEAVMEVEAQQACGEEAGGAQGEGAGAHRQCLHRGGASR